MNYGLAFIVLNEHFEYAPVCIIFIGPSTRSRPIFNFPIFRKNRASLELLNIVFENSLPKGFLGEIKNSNFFICRQVLDIYRQRLLKGFSAKPHKMPKKKEIITALYSKTH